MLRTVARVGAPAVGLSIVGRSAEGGVWVALAEASLDVDRLWSSAISIEAWPLAEVVQERPCRPDRLLEIGADASPARSRPRSAGSTYRVRAREQARRKSCDLPRKP